MWAILRGFSIVVGVCGTIALGQNAIQDPVASSAVQQRPDLKNVRVDQKPGAQLPVFARFRDDSGKDITFGSLLRGRPVILLPIFFRCKGVCEVELQGILNALIKDKALTPGKNVDVVVLSIDPTEQSNLARAKKASALEEYGRSNTADGWHFLTGDMEAIRSVTDPMGFSFTYDAVRDRVNHPSGIMILTPSGRVSTYMLGGLYKPEALNHDIRLASNSGIAPRSEDLYFGCVHVDPLTGRRSIAIQRVLQLLGLATVGALLIGIVSMTRKGRVIGRKESPIAT